MTSEFGFIDSLRRRGLSRIGDDCAVMPKSDTHDLVVTTDLLVEEIDFRRDWTTPAKLGAKALAVSLSDVAAMGATPTWSMVSIGVPEEVWKAGFVDAFYEGYLATAERFGVELVGGDVSRTPDRIVVDSIAAGECPKGTAILRSGAKPGDAIFVSGPLGGSAAGLRLLMDGIRAETCEEWQRGLIERHLEPLPEVSAAAIIAAAGGATAMIDVSDGLSSDLGHICRESAVGARIFANRIPLDTDVQRVATDRASALRLALGGGEDYRLLFTAPQDFFSRLADPSEAARFSHLGTITQHADMIELIDGDETHPVAAFGWRHF